MIAPPGNHFRELAIPIPIRSGFACLLADVLRLTPRGCRTDVFLVGNCPSFLARARATRRLSDTT